MKDHSVILILLIASFLLPGCSSAVPTAPPLVTIPAGPLPPTETATSAPPTETPPPATATISVVQTAPPPQGIAGLRLFWTWEEVSRPSALAASGNRLAAIIADGRFAWLEGNRGQVEASSYLWDSFREGESWGQVHTDGVVALVDARESFISPGSGLAESRARVVAYDAGANELWSLPTLETQHFYSTAMTINAALVGQWPYGLENRLAAYELLSGRELWSTEAGPEGYQVIAQDGARLIALVNDGQGGAVAAFDLGTGNPLWRWKDPAFVQPDGLLLGDEVAYVQAASGLAAIDMVTGLPNWINDFASAPEAGFGQRAELLLLAPAPSLEGGLRPGVSAVDGDSGMLRWNALTGLVVDPLATSPDALWALARDFDSGAVILTALQAESGEVLAQVQVGDHPDRLYRIVVAPGQVYVLGDVLQAFGY